MANIQYIGARYVPKFYLNPDDNSNDWKQDDFEPLTIVTFNNDSYTSKKAVPNTIGAPNLNPEYWACTTKYTAALVALETTVQNIEDFIGDEPLDTVSQILSGAINEDHGKIKGLEKVKEFESVRYGSIEAVNANRCIAFIKSNTGFIGVGDDGATSFHLIEYDNSLNITNTHVYNYTIHANGLFLFSNRIYVVDSANFDLYIINPVNFAVEEIVSDLRGYNIISGNIDNNGNAYLLGSSGGTRYAYHINSSNAVIESIALENVEINSISGVPVIQNILVYDKAIYLLYNRPNILIVYDFSGKCIGTVDIGEGNGYYPYCECETLFYNGDYIMMTCNAYNNRTIEDGEMLVQIFTTNLAKPVGNNSKYGQSTSVQNSLYLDNSGTKVLNPDGTNTAPFHSALEAYTVYNYQQKHCENSLTLYISGGSYENERLIFANCNVNMIPSSRKKFKSVEFLSCTGAIVNMNAVLLSSIASDITFSGGTVNDLYVRGGKINLTDVHIANGSLYLDYCVVQGHPRITNISSDNIHTTGVKCNGLFRAISGGIDANNPTAIDTNPLEKFLLSTDYYTKLNIGAICSAYDMALNLDVILSSGEKTTLRNGSPITKYSKVMVGDAANTVFVVFEIVFKTDFTITIQPTSAKDISGTDVAIGTLSLSKTYLSLDQQYYGY